ncbi:MAG: universal stress protein [Wenzhouxiangellaceae bacterium]|nr:universal stress protein [Wenzhouxiangellaceae bacterium]
MSERIRSILVAVDSSAGGLAALQQAAELARRIDAELSGLFIEDEDLVRLAGLPFARELPAGGGEWRPLSTEVMERDLARLARDLERELEVLAGRLEIPWRFRRRRGRVATELLAACSECELVAVGTAGMRGGPSRLGSTARRLLAEATSSVMLIAPGAVLRAASFAVVFDAGQAAEGALARALELTPPDRSLDVLIAVDDRAAADTLKARARELAGTRALRFRTLREKSGSALLDSLADLAPLMLVLGETDWIEPPMLERIVARLDGGLLRVRTRD